ncbi:hypothetical protein ACNI4H_03150 [Klebsiella aerogenes]|uniref:hypothetical protein n=1 Tax=Klebsiella aerogenes TaxID=548 RepID=UPI003A883E4D
MTKSTITKEWLQQTIAELESVRDEIPFGIDTNSELEIAAFKLALAAMDSEPVAWTDEEELRDANESGSGYFFGIERDANKFADPRRQIMLYRHAQPAPVVPDAATAIRACLSEFPESARDIVEECADIAENACRAAMLDNCATVESRNNAGCSPKNGLKCATVLQAEPVTTANKLGNSPVIPDGSEHCPCCGKKLRRACSAEGCGGKHVAHGLCKKHYDMKRWEDPEQVRKFREAGKRYRRKTKSAAAAPQEVSGE